MPSPVCGRLGYGRRPSAARSPRPARPQLPLRAAGLAAPPAPTLGEDRARDPVPRSAARPSTAGTATGTRAPAARPDRDQPCRRRPPGWAGPSRKSRRAARRSGRPLRAARREHAVRQAQAGEARAERAGIGDSRSSARSGAAEALPCRDRPPAPIGLPRLSRPDFVRPPGFRRLAMPTAYRRHLPPRQAMLPPCCPILRPDQPTI